MEFAFLDHPGPIPFAHRGGAGEWPENTMPAFEGAVRLGYRYVETDVHATSDGVLLAFHDDVLDRVTDHAGDIAELPWDVVRTAQGRRHASRSRCSRTCSGRSPTCASTSTRSTTPRSAPLVEVIEKHDAVDRVCIGSFSDKRVAALRKAPRAAAVHRARPEGRAPVSWSRRAGMPAGPLRRSPARRCHRREGRSRS